MARRGVQSILGLSALVCASYANAFEVQGYSPGMSIPPRIERECAKVRNVDSGIPGYRCSSILGGEAAILKIAVFEDKVVAVIFIVQNGHMSPMLKAFREKYGPPTQRYRHNKDYHWSEGPRFLFIKQLHMGARRGGYRVWGYSVLLVDSDLFGQASKANAKDGKDGDACGQFGSLPCWSPHTA
jgi:hypothetical protein